MGPLGNPETSVSDHLTSRNNPEHGIINLNRGGNPRSLTDLKIIQGGSNMTGTNCDLFTHNQSRSYLNHLVASKEEEKGNLSRQ